MNPLHYNFKGKNDSKIQTCICNENILKNEHLFNCGILNESNLPNVSYLKSFDRNLQEQCEIVNIIHKNIEKV